MTPSQIPLPTATTIGRSPAPSADLPAGLTVEDAQRVAAALQASHAQSTRTLYAHTWRVWARWCTARGIEPLPADPAALAAYLVERAAHGTAVTTLDMACTAIRHVHRQHGLANPAEDDLVRQVRLGLRRTYGTAPRRQARPLTVAEISQIVAAIDNSTPIGIRDTAIILLGYASALRGSELVALTPDHIETKPGGLLITIRGSKTDQEHAGHLIGVAHGRHAATDPSRRWPRGPRSAASGPAGSSPGFGPAASATSRWATMSSPACSAAELSPPASTAPASPPTRSAPATPPPPRSPAYR